MGVRARLKLLALAIVLVGIAACSGDGMTEQEVMALIEEHSVPGDKGDAGPMGPEGPQGLQGATGASGQDGEDGEDGQLGKDGKDGKDGESGQAFMTVSWDVPASDSFSDGTWLVGDDIEAGTYRVIPEEGYCYWERLSGLTGDFDDIIANGNPGGPAYVEILATDRAFTSSDCGNWAKVE